MPVSKRPDAGRRKQRRSTIATSRSDVFTRHARKRVPSRRARAWIEDYCTVPVGLGAGKRYRLRPTHRRWHKIALDDEALVTIISGPRGLGKTGWQAATGVHALFDQPAAQVLFLGVSMRSAMRAYGRAVRIIELDKRLSDQAMIYRNKAEPWTELPLRGAMMRPLPAEEKYIVGEDPTLILMDEMGYISSDTYEAMQTSLGKDPDSPGKLIGFGTPGLGVVDSDSTPNQMWALRAQSLSDDPPTDLRYIEHAAGPTDDPGDKRTWKRANPMLGDMVSERAVALDYATMPPSRFGQMRLGLWTQHESSWMPIEAWDALDVDGSELGDGALIALGFDGSVRRDSTALVAYETSTGRLVVLGHWAGDGTAIPRRQVMDTIRRAFDRYNVAVMLADPWYWRTELQTLADELGEDRVVEWNTASVARMGPASDAFLAAVLKRELTVDGSAALRAHALNAVAKRTKDGDVIARDARRPRDTDLATAAILAYEAGRTWEAPPRPAVW